jgi:hypothetical protein
VTDFLDEKRREITDRLAELKPLVDEFNRLETAVSALAGVGGARRTRAAAASRRRGPGRPKGSVSRTAAKASRTRKPARKKPGRPPGKAKARPGKARAGKARAGRARAGRRKGSGTRAAEALALVKSQPGIAIPELAQKMGIKQNYLYRVLPGLEQENKVQKQGRGWHPKS